MRFEGIVIRKQAVKCEFKSVDIPQNSELHNGFFLTQRLFYVCLLQFWGIMSLFKKNKNRNKVNQNITFFYKLYLCCQYTFS